MKTIFLLSILVLAPALLLNAASMENLRKSSENISVKTSSPRAAAADKNEIKPVPADGFKALGDFIVKILKLIFNPNGDIEIETPVDRAPVTEGDLDDDQGEEETYTEGQTYEPVDESQLPQDPFSAAAPAAAQPAAQPAAQADIISTPGGSDRAGDTIPPDLRQKAVDYFNANSASFANKRYIGIVDFAAHSSRDRFWILDMESGAVRAMHVAHGVGSDPDGDGYATRFSNVPNSRASSLGYYKTGALYTGKHGRSMRLHGLSNTNSNALSRAVVVHDSNYVREGNYRAGRSYGCLAVANTEIAPVLSALRGGALIYAGLSGSEF